MKLSDRSLRGIVYDWLGRDETIQITRVARNRDMPWRAVKVEVTRSSGSFAVVFFRHNDGSWRVYPPAVRRPSIMQPGTQKLVCLPLAHNHAYEF